MSGPEYQGISQFLFFSSGSEDEETMDGFVRDEKISDEAVRKQVIEKQQNRAISMTKAELKMLKDNLMLPKPMTLVAKTAVPREDVFNVHDFPMKKCVKFDGADCDDDCIFENYYDVDEILYRLDEEKENERNTLREYTDEDITKIPFPKLMDYFKEDDTLIYKRDPNHVTTIYTEFNRSQFSLKKYFRQAMEKNLKRKEKSRCVTEDPQSEFEDCYYHPTGPEDTTLVFESRFECGNLSMASKVKDNEYNLIMQNDINTLGYGQWFFFETRNTRRFNKVKFNILNFRKHDSLHNYGMKILVYSVQEFDRSGKGWYRGGKNIKYQCTEIVRANRPQKFFRSLTFEFEYQYDMDRVFFAFTYPYTYSDLCDYLDKIENVTAHSPYLLRSTLCRTIAGNKCELLTITNNNDPGECDLKKCVVLTARVHPGETQSSYMIQGVIDFLISDKPEAVILRDKFIFKIIPMLNPDGVIHGNYRCDLSGMDLNRRWRKTNPLLTPTIHHVKNLMIELRARYKIAFYCDFHGHSKKKNIFMYGCEDERNPYRCREFPYILSKISPEFFDFENCHYNKTKEMAGTARQSVNEQLHVLDSFTLEASFHGPTKTGKHFTMQNLITFGTHFAKALAIYFSKMLGQADKHKDLESMLLNDQEKKNLEVREGYVKELHKLKLNDLMDSGSDSEVSEDELPAEDRNRLYPGQSKKKFSNHNRRSSAIPESSQTKRETTGGASSASPQKIKAFKTISNTEKLDLEEELKKSSNEQIFRLKSKEKHDKRPDIPLMLPPRISLLPQFPTPRKLHIHRKDFPTPYMETMYNKKMRNHIASRAQEFQTSELNGLRLGPNRLDKTQPPGQFYQNPNTVEAPMAANTSMFTLNLDKKVTLKSEPLRTITPSKFYSTQFKQEFMDSPVRSQMLSRLRMGKRSIGESKDLRESQYQAPFRENNFQSTLRETREIKEIRETRESETRVTKEFKDEPKREIRETLSAPIVEEIKLDTPPPIQKKFEIKSYRMNAENLIDSPAPIKKKAATELSKPRTLRSTKLMSSRRSTQDRHKPEMIKLLEDRKKGDKIPLKLNQVEIQAQDDLKLMQLLEKFINTKVYIDKSPRDRDNDPVLTTDEGIHGFITNETRRSVKCEAAFQDYNMHESPRGNNHHTHKSSLMSTGRKKSGSSKDDHLQSLLLRRASQGDDRTNDMKMNPPIRTTTFRIKEPYDIVERASRDYTPPQSVPRK